MKECKICKITKALSDFNKDKSKKDGRQIKCRACERAYRDANREKIAARYKAYRAANRERKAATNKAWAEANRERVAATQKAYREANPEQHAASQKAWAEANPDKRNALRAKRRAAKLQRTPQWSNLEAIAEVYALAKKEEERLGVAMHVDHIIPLQGELVSGLHVASNLQVIPASENCSKGNKFNTEEQL